MRSLMRESSVTGESNHTLLGILQALIFNGLEYLVSLPVCSDENILDLEEESVLNIPLEVMCSKHLPE